jgi:integrase
VQRHLDTNSAPLHNLPLASVDQAVIASRLNAIAKDGGAVSANRTRASLSAMFVWAMGEGLAAANPVAHTNRREEKPRERVLTDAELRTVWKSLDDDDYSVIVKLLMLTGQRKGEIAGLRWSEIDFKRGLISLPSERTKNARPHDLPISHTVQSLLQSRPRTDGRDMVFGSGDGPYSGWSSSKAALDARAAGLKDWVLHDIRRSVATGMADIGIQPHIIEAVLNHVSGHKGGIAGIYNRATYSKEKAEALARWDAHIAAVVKEVPSKVAGLRGRR